MRKLNIFILGLMAMVGSLCGQNLPKGFFVEPDSISPDGRYGITVPKRGEVGEEGGVRNSLVEVKTGRVVMEIAGDVAWDHTNHASIEPAKWTADSSLVLWNVAGKWFPDALVLVKLEGATANWQVDVLKRAQVEILARTKKTAPADYAKAKKANAGNGSAYPDGFSVDVTPVGELALPMRFKVALTSNPKGIEGMPTLESHMDIVVGKDGKVSAEKFALGPGESENF